ncbi:hypothetical protein [Aster yellows witches'-broom phytoplasma]|nr:hypothetical protein [Aster yellows witches'-broom phytoplasma]
MKQVQMKNFFKSFLKKIYQKTIKKLIELLELDEKTNNYYKKRFYNDSGEVDSVNKDTWDVTFDENEQ